MPKPRILRPVGEQALLEIIEHRNDSSRDAKATGTRYLLQTLAELAKGNTVEVRVPPFGAVQCIEGPGHTRGTPPNVVEMDVLTWVDLATGSLDWAEGISTGRIHASGQRADLRDLMPLRRPLSE
jgi:hypothetical protein